MFQTMHVGVPEVFWRRQLWVGYTGSWSVCALKKEDKTSNRTIARPIQKLDYLSALNALY